MIALITLGGTIAMTNSEKEGATPSLDATTLAADFSELKCYELSNISSPNIDFALLERVLDCVQTCIDEGASGIILTQGTDTMEESAFYLNLFYKHEIPFIITGSMRANDEASSDAKANLLAAITLAKSEKAKNQGVLVVLNDSVHYANYVKKSHSTNLHTFTSGERGLAGKISENEFYLFGKAQFRPCLNRVKSLKNIALLKLFLDYDEKLLEFALGNFDGVVLAGFGSGHVKASSMQAIEKAINSGKFVVFCTRCEDGCSSKKLYAYDGSEVHLQKVGAINARFLGDLKARIFLAAALSNDFNKEKIASFYEQF